MMAARHPTLVRAATYLPVKDLGRAADHYEQTFGFTREYTGGAPPTFVIMSRDGWPIMLRLVSEDSRVVPVTAQGGTWDVFFWVEGVEALHEELAGRGAAIVYGPVLQDYGVLEFAVRDPEGHVLGFGEARSR